MYESVYAVYTVSSTCFFLTWSQSFIGENLDWKGQGIRGRCCQFQLVEDIISMAALVALSHSAPVSHDVPLELVVSACFAGLW